MTMTAEFDRLLGAVLEADGPQTVPPGLVETALFEARSVDQRRPLVRALDPLGWPPLWEPIPRPAARRMATLALVGLLVVAAVVAAVLVGSPRPPRVLADGQRAFVWLGDTAYQFTMDDVTGHPVTPGRSVGGCPTLVAGTTAVARFGFEGWDLVDFTTDAPVSSVSFNTAGFERWSPDARRMAILDAAGRVGIATFDDLAEPVITWYEAPGIQSLDWSAGGDRLGVTTQVGDELAITILDVVSGDQEVVHRQQAGPAGAFGSGPPRSLQWSSLGTTLALQIVEEGDATTITLVDIADGQVTTLQGITGASALAQVPISGISAPTRDGRTFALRDSPTEIVITDARGTTLARVPVTRQATDMAWSADGTLLAFRDGDALTVVARDGTGRRTAIVGATAAFRWDAEAAELIVASAGGAGGVAVERYEAATLTAFARIGLPAADPSPSPPPGRGFVEEEAASICLQLDVFDPVLP